MNIRLLFGVLAGLVLGGCASNKMIESVEQAVPMPAADMAQVIFMRPSSYGGMIQSSIFDITAGEAQLIGIVSTGTQISYMLDPGKHKFMVVSEAADFLEANLSPGKTYYAMVTARMGAWKARFSMHPVRNGGDGDFQYQSEKFQKWLKKVRFVDNTTESTAWFEENKASIDEKQRKYWEVWQQKSAADLAERTLRPEDGV